MKLINNFKKIRISDNDPKQKIDDYFFVKNVDFV